MSTERIICSYPVLYLVAQLCLTLGDSTYCSPPGSSVHGDSPGKNTGVGSLSLLQGNFPTQESNQGLLHYRRILYRLIYQGSPHLVVPITVLKIKSFNICYLLRHFLIFFLSLLVIMFHGFVILYFSF